jgi:outer membrane lipoprotein-sorting protein
MKMRHKSWFLALALGLGVVAPAGPTQAAASSAGAKDAVVEQPKDAETLLAALATVEGLEARFTEKKHLALLKAPLVSEGRIYYTRPGYMVRKVDAPSKSTVRIGPKSLEVSDDRGTQSFDLSGRPDIKTFVESFVHVVAGDHDALASIYELSFEPAPDPEGTWLLTLIPSRKPLSELITKMELSGRGYSVETIRILEKRGDSTEIAMTSVDPKRTFTAQEKRDIFGLPAK